MSDSGIALPFAKCDNYHASSRTPWIVRWPGVVKEGIVNDKNLISGVDYYPASFARIDNKKTRFKSRLFYCGYNIGTTNVDL